MASKTTHEIVREQSRKRKRALDLKGKSIEALVEGDFADTETNQETIDLCGNYITTLAPNVFSRFSNLAILNLMSNELSSIPSLHSLPNLCELYLSKNKIKQITNLDLYPKLAILDLRANQIENFTNLEKAPTLTKLSLSSNKLTHLASFPVLPRLRTLFLFGNKLSDRHDCLQGLQQNPDLETLILRANNVDPMGAEKDDTEYHAFVQKLYTVLPNLKWLDWEPVRSQLKP